MVTRSDPGAQCRGNGIPRQVRAFPRGTFVFLLYFFPPLLPP